MLGSMEQSDSGQYEIVLYCTVWNSLIPWVVWNSLTPWVVCNSLTVDSMEQSDSMGSVEKLEQNRALFVAASTARDMGQK